MPLFLSWKQKFRLLIFTTLSSLALMTAASFWASQTLGNALQARESATAYAGASATLMNQWLKLGAERRRLTADDEKRFQDGLTALSALSRQYAERAADLDDDAVTNSSRQIDELLQEDVQLQRSWLEQSHELGLTPFTGQRAKLAESGKGLERVSISLIQASIAEALSNQRDYLATFDGAYAERVRAALGDLQARIVELEWQDSQVGKAVATYSADFATADAMIQRIAATEKHLLDLGRKIENSIATQCTYLQQNLLATATRQADQARSTANWVMGLTFAAVSLFMLITLGRASRLLMAQLNRVNRLLAQVAAGNLTARIDVGHNHRDEFNQLGSASNQMTQGIAGVIRQVLDGNRELYQLHSYLNDAMRRLEENSSQVEMQTEQAASASQQISATVHEMAQRTTDVGNATQAAYQAARNGASVINASADNMRHLAQLIQDSHAQVSALTQSSTKVTSIIDVINGLADQTNLLALNAAIEAARAGEAGRGFSVVADEVRSLAQKTVAATTDIAVIVDELHQQTRQMDQLMSSGLGLATQGERSSAEVAQAIDGITGSMEDLSAEMSQVVVAIEQISCTTEEIAAKVEGINLHTGKTRTLRLSLDEHTQGLSRQVEALNHSANQFRIA
ncbi:methyl-accepting chemotaxis protein [Pseudomonas argentinensis]|uniref:Methyl-accepting chemotaxis protein n=1 Tax=Phytopseudomonas argentinensis TaxID=289370 RepID=A0A1I3KSF0_9GAMM|nr:methyl-accepting chemotaxis protein [Pseudomonas argentinensis]KAB0550417.1 methyl-accepting chemotaxis protein [Pseudomonas argentinensis]SFI75439.1 methyl-accepting chemotaxis protein [Pseudomonas argentinensis]